MSHVSCDVAIIGAGLAGLAAAELLKTKGYKVKVIDSEDRVGGRVLTHHLQDGIHFELGPFSLGNGEQPLWDYIHRFALPIIQHTEMEKIFQFEGLKGTMNDTGTFLEGEEQKIPLFRLMSYFRPKLEGITEDMPLNHALEHIGASPKAISWLQANTLGGLLGNGFKSISTHAFLTFLKQYDNSTSFYALKGGNDQLAQAFAEQLKGDIIFKERVKKIEQLKDRCFLHSDTLTIEAKRVIVAIPLPEIKNVEISPSLSERKQKAIQNTPYTTCARISIIAPPAILDAKPRGGVFLFSDRLGWFREQTAFQIDPSKKTVLNISAVGDQAQKLSKLPIEEWKKSIDDVLLENYPKWDPKQAEYYTHFLKEGYSYFPENIKGMQDSLREPENRLHFAGEHTSDKYSSMNGALDSGIRAAEEVLRSKEL